MVAWFSQHQQEIKQTTDIIQINVFTVKTIFSDYKFSIGKYFPEKPLFVNRLKEIFFIFKRDLPACKAHPQHHVLRVVLNFFLSGFE